MSTATKTHRVTDFEIVADMPLPDGSIYEQVKAVQAYYKRIGGGDSIQFEPYAAIKLLDQILADRKGEDNIFETRAIPTEYAPIVAFLMQQEFYSAEWTHVIARQIDRWDTAMGLDSIEEEDQQAVQALLNDIREEEREQDNELREILGVDWDGRIRE
jgi:hypothetical protein